MKLTIYKYSIENEPSIRQGDIFCNLPYFNYDYLMKLRPIRQKAPKDESKQILTEIIQNGGQILVEGFYYGKWGILASQDCDVRPNRDLIFFPLFPVSSLLEENNIVEAVENNIVKSTRHIYIPKLNPPDEQIYGPFEINFYNPFNLPYNIILDNLQYCWKARLIEKARKVFIGKLTHFYSRTPVDEFIFLENEEITNYLITDWKIIWSKKSEEKYKEGLQRIDQIKKMLKFVKREQDIDHIFYYDVTLVRKIKDVVSQIEWFANAKEILELSKSILNNFKEKPLEANNSFMDLMRNYFFIEESFLNKFETFLEDYFDDLKELRKNISLGNECDPELVYNIFPLERIENKKIIKSTIEDIKDAKNAIRDIPKDFLKLYEDLV
ncbi:MAG: hypothetical protein ACFFG0_07670 [Candidatus Thorarchaeota archaeon]